MKRIWKKLLVTVLSVSMLMVSLPLETQAAKSTQQQIKDAEKDKNELEDIMDAMPPLPRSISSTPIT